MLKAAIEGERQLRASTEQTVSRLDASLTATRKEILDLIGDGQATALEHSEVLRRVEQELVAFKLDLEVRLAEESKQLSVLAERQRATASEIELATAGETIGRIKELESALLQERGLRKALEEEVSALRTDRSALVAEVTDCVLRETALSGGGITAVAALEDKVKECGRLILRMGGDLMEEAKRRQALEAEAHELRMRLSSVEAVARSPLGMPPLPPAYVGMAPDMYPIAPLPGASDAVSPPGSLPGAAFPWPPYGNRQASFELSGLSASIDPGMATSCAASSAAAAAAGHMRDLQSMGLAPQTSQAGSSSGRTPGAAEVLGSMSSGRGGEMPPVRPEGMASTWSPAKDAAIDERLSRMAVPPQDPLSASSSYAQLVAKGIAPPLSSGGSISTPPPSGEPSSSSLGDRRHGGAPSSASALRMTREQLDARVQQILGKHGAMSTALPPRS